MAKYYGKIGFVKEIEKSPGVIIQDKTDIKDKTKFSMLKEISMFKMKILDGIDSFVQIYGFLSVMSELFEEDKKKN